ncbi:GNAT family N-acetyltransferase [Undibacterium sp. Ji42W]|uniref:GNAT family N-acetyltransferase n=1 Tax=Undibacterium sp. Ji42W TaxID=3413039 RepID=UPI003BF37DDA
MGPAACGFAPFGNVATAPCTPLCRRLGACSDIGVIANIEGDGAPIGACWMRLVPDGMGLAYINEHTPQLGIALLPSWQHKGYGKLMMLAALDAARQRGIKQVSLTVHPENPAAGMYSSCGFVQTGVRNSYLLMQVTL